MAVFYRTNALSRVTEDALRTAGVPYTIARGTAFYDREEIKNAVAYMRVVANQADDVSLTRIVNTPTRGIGKTSLDRVRLMAEAAGLPIFEALRAPADAGDISPRSANAMTKFVEMVDGWTAPGRSWAPRSRAPCTNSLSASSTNRGCGRSTPSRRRRAGPSRTWNASTTSTS